MSVNNRVSPPSNSVLLVEQCPLEVNFEKGTIGTGRAKAGQARFFCFWSAFVAKAGVCTCHLFNKIPPPFLFSSTKVSIL
jgi:hypothetical protein